MPIEVTATSDNGSTFSQTLDIAVSEDHEFDTSAIIDTHGGDNTVSETVSRRHGRRHCLRVHRIFPAKRVTQRTL